MRAEWRYTWAFTHLEGRAMAKLECTIYDGIEWHTTCHKDRIVKVRS